MTEEERKTVEDNFVSIISESILESGEVGIGSISFDEAINKTLAEEERFCYIKSPSYEDEQGADMSAALVIKVKRVGVSILVSEIVGLLTGDVEKTDVGFLEIQGDGFLSLANKLAKDGVFDSLYA